MENADQRTTFKAINSLLKLDAPAVSLAENLQKTCDDFSGFFHDKVENIRSSICAKQSDPLPVPDGDRGLLHISSTMNSFNAISAEEIEKTVMAAPQKCCALDIIPTWLLRKTLSAHIPTLTLIVNKTLSDGIVLPSTRNAVVSPLLKKPTLDATVLKNYRPVSNLSFIGKNFKLLVLSQLNDHINHNNLAEIYQSAYRRQHSTETALLKVQADIAGYLDKSQAALMVLLDLSAAFDTIDHGTLLRTLELSYGISGCALSWFNSYLSARSQKVCIGSHSSTSRILSHGVPQGSVLGPILFCMYTSPLRAVIERHGILYHKYADDLQLYVPYNPSCTDSRESAWAAMSKCILDVETWMSQNYLQLNRDKTEVINFQSSHHIALFPNSSLRVGDVSLTPSLSVRNLGVHIDEHLTMQDQVTATVRACNMQLRNISHARQYLSDTACQTAVQSLVISRLDYCCSLLGGLPACQILRLQVVQNRAARLITRTPSREHITPVLARLHWLPVRYRIQFRILVYAYKCVHNLAPGYLTELVPPYRPSRALHSSDDPTLLAQTSAKKRVGNANFAYMASTLWNKLPRYLRLYPTVTRFKRHLKAYLFAKHFN